MPKNIISSITSQYTKYTHYPIFRQSKRQLARRSKFLYRKKKKKKTNIYFRVSLRARNIYEILLLAPCTQSKLSPKRGKIIKTFKVIRPRRGYTRSITGYDRYLKSCLSSISWRHLTSRSTTSEQ